MTLSSSFSTSSGLICKLAGLRFLAALASRTLTPPRMIVFPSALCWKFDTPLHFYWSHILCLWKFTSLVLIPIQSLAKTIWHESYKCTSVHCWYSTNTNDIFFAVKFWIPSLLLQASSNVAVGIFLFHISLLNAVSSWKHFHNNIKHQIFRLFSSSLSGYFKWVWSLKPILSKK